MNHELVPAGEGIGPVETWPAGRRSASSCSPGGAERRRRHRGDPRGRGRPREAPAASPCLKTPRRRPGGARTIRLPHPMPARGIAMKTARRTALAAALTLAGLLRRRPQPRRRRRRCASSARSPRTASTCSTCRSGSRSSTPRARACCRSTSSAGRRRSRPSRSATRCKTGVVDMAMSTGAFYTNVMPGGRLPQADADPGRRAAQERRLRLRSTSSGCRRATCVYLARMVENQPFHLYLNKKIDKPDLTGLKIRITPVYREFFAVAGRQRRDHAARARSTPRSSAAWSTATAGRSAASSTSTGTRRPSSASTPASTTPRWRSS